MKINNTHKLIKTYFYIIYEDVIQYLLEGKITDNSFKKA